MLPACKRCSASRSPEYTREDEELDEEEEEDEVVGVACSLSLGDADRGGDRGSAEDVFEGGAKLVALEEEEGAEFPLKGGFLPPAPSAPGGVSTDSGMTTCRAPPCDGGKLS